MASVGSEDAIFVGGVIVVAVVVVVVEMEVVVGVG